VGIKEHGPFEGLPAPVIVAERDQLFCGNDGSLCDSGDGEEGIEVSKFTESFWECGLRSTDQFFHQ